MGTLMVADIALALSVLNLLIWITVFITVRKLFRKLLPTLAMAGIAPAVSLKNSPIYDRIGEPDK